MRTLLVGQKVVTRVPGRNYYRTTVGSKYYYGPDEIRAGEEGIVGASKVPSVRTTARHPYFYCVDFPSGARAAYYMDELGVK